MSRTLLWLALALLAVFAAQAIQARWANRVEITLHGPDARRLDSSEFPIRLDRSEIQYVSIDFLTQGHALTGVLDVRIDQGKVWFATPSGVERIGLGADENDCRRLPTGGWQCRHVLRTKRLDRDSYIFYASSPEARMAVLHSLRRQATGRRQRRYPGYFSSARH